MTALDNINDKLAKIVHLAVQGNGRHEDGQEQLSHAIPHA